MTLSSRAPPKLHPPRGALFGTDVSLNRGPLVIGDLPSRPVVPSLATREVGGLSIRGGGGSISRGPVSLSMRRESDLLHVAYFSTTPLMPEGRATRRGSTFTPPAICGCDGSKPSRNSRLNTSERAIKKASFRLLARRSAALKKASPK